MSDERINVYTCREGHQTVTVERGEGVTPMFLRCRTGDGCQLMARSAMYRVADPKPTPTHEWYRPGDWERGRLDADTLEHVSRGGFILRPLGKGKHLLRVRTPDGSGVFRVECDYEGCGRLWEQEMVEPVVEIPALMGELERLTDCAGPR